MRVYICKKSLYSFLTAVYIGFNEQCLITSDSALQLPLGCETVCVVTDPQKAKAVQGRICAYDKNAVNDIVMVLRSCNEKKEQIAFEYVRRLLYAKTPIINAFNMTEVIAFNDVLNKVTFEAHRLKGFLRFTESASGAFYAPYSPDNDITELLMPHFAERFSQEKFVIHDIKRKIAGIYNGQTYIIGRLEETEIYISENERAFETLWKKYYSSVNISSRPHEKQMKGYMPVRYWKFLTEKNQ